MKTIIEIEGTPKKDDLLIFDGEKFIHIPKNVLLSEFYANLESFKQDLIKYKAEVENFKKGVNLRLKEQNDVINILVKGE